MKTSTIYELYKQTPAHEAEISVGGWAKTVRSSKNIGFIELNDGSFFKGIQVVFESSLANFDEVSKAGAGTSMQIEGKLIHTPNAKQPFEMQATSVQILGTCPPEYPLQKKRHTMEFLRSMPHLRARTNTFSAVFRLRSAASFALHKFFEENRFVYIHTPIITASDCEGAGEMFRVTTLPPQQPPLCENGEVDYSQDFFKRMTSLTVSGQLEAEGMALAFGRVYTFGPTFRAENSNTPRHAAEFWMLEPEMAFTDLAGDMDVAEAMIKYVVRYVLEHNAEEMEFFNSFFDKELLSRLTNLLEADFERITYTKAIEVLEKHNDQFQYKAQWGADLQTEHERFLTEQVYNKPVFVTDYPKEIKSFYMRQNDDGKTVAAVDMLVPGVGELIGGSQREERLDRLTKRMQEVGMSLEEYSWFLDLRRFGSVEHAGFGLGFERLIMYLTGIANIRDAIPFPRTAGGYY